MADERWITTADLIAAIDRYTAQVPGYVTPAAFTVARLDNGQFTFAEVNDVGNTRRLPAVILAHVCGYTARSGRYPLMPDELARAIDLLAPAESATHMDHPNLWSWRELLATANASSTFAALVLARPDDRPGDDPWMIALLQRLTT